MNASANLFKDPQKLIEDETRRLGAWADDGQIRFRVWAPNAKKVEVVTTTDRWAMTALEHGYYEYKTAKLKVGDRYWFSLDGGAKLPDPCSRFQPEGPHGASEIVARDFAWTDQAWPGVEFNQWVIYELHVGTFSDAGTFAGVTEKIEYLKSTGINVIEIMPVSQFAGSRNWGYDGVGLFATQNSYGTPDHKAPLALKKLVDTCHRHGLAVILDVVYNHLGPEGNYLSQYGPYFQSKYKTPWGDALNYDGDWSDEVRRFFLENARQWLEEFHFDGLRLDAVHAIFDTSARPFLEDLTQMTRELEKKTKRPLKLIAESDANDSRILRKPSEGGLGMDGQWADDLHHTVHALLTGERQGYYADYGTIEQLAKIYRDGVVFHGEYSDFRHRSYGRPYDKIDRSRLVVCSQNHDQIGNRGFGERLISLVGPEKARVAAACVFLSPGLPLLFMGEEFGEINPFLYFIDHTDDDLREAVRKGRREEFSFFYKDGASSGTEVPDPAAKETFALSKLNWGREASADGQSFLKYYRKLAQLSKWIRRERLFETSNVKTEILNQGRVLKVRGQANGNEVCAYFSFSDKTEKVPAGLPEKAPRKPLVTCLTSGEDDRSTDLANGFDLGAFTVMVFATSGGGRPE